MIRFLANENVPLATVKRLQQEGFDVVSVSTDLPSVKDESVILFASMDNRIIITFDRDYGELIFKNNIAAPPGIIYFRLHSFRPEDPAEILLNFLRLDIDFEGFFSVISENNLRQKKL
jgi:predicted nuclease of predicted toxin-antitoxin system